MFTKYDKGQGASFIIPQNLWITSTFLSFSSFFKLVKIQFPVKMAKERNFLHVVDLSFETKFPKYYHFSFHYRKTVTNKWHQDKMFTI